MSGVPAPGARRFGRPRALARMLDSDLAHNFLHSPVALVSAAILAICVLAAAFAPLLAPHDPFDLASLNLMNSFKPPAFLGGSDADWWFPLGADDQGRDVLSAIMYGARLSLLVGISAILFAVILGTAVGLIAGYQGGLLELVLMRITDIQLSFPTILIALLIDGVVSTALPHGLREQLQIYVLIVSIGIAQWPQFARTVRSSTLVERRKDYVMAARVIGIRPLRIMFTHVLPNALGPVTVIATLNLGLAIITEATLSFLGVGLPPTEPSLGTLISNGDNFLFSGEWWVTVFPGLALVLMVLSINLLGDWLRDALNPRLR